ncbi:MAG: hypothetical protein RLZZ444_3133 [Pseudomonadota bacterium]|jgi:uncharacterized protein (TIGR01244 family)
MEIRQINDEYSVTAQIALEDLEEIKALGFKSVVCNRPDDEDPGQPTFAEIAARAAELGLETAHVPISGPPPAEAVLAMVDVLDELPKPMLSYCRSGNRSTIIYQQTLNKR